MAQRRDLSDAERAVYREGKRQEAEQRLDALLSEKGWANWLRVRKSLHSYSWTNQVLIAQQAYAQHALAEAGDPDAPATACSPHPSLVKAAWKWKRDGYHPAKGTRGLFVWTFMDRVRTSGTWSCCGQTIQKNKACPGCGKAPHYFVLKPVFDASQVRSFETGEPPVLDLPEGQPIEGDNPGALLMRPLAEHALAEGWVSEVQWYVESEHGELGSFNPSTRAIRIVRAGSANARLRVLIHELAHAAGITSNNADLELTYAEAEVAVESVVFSPGRRELPVVAGLSVGDGCHRRRRSRCWPVAVGE
jgi:hypothetical protein